MSIHFILNQKEVVTNAAQGLTMVDFVRYRQHLTGTKIGCREGDCGACTVLVGELSNGELIYRSVTSCLMPLGSAHGKHIVTIEGLNMEKLNPVQQAMSDEAATQCGFCTPGFVVSLAGFCLSKKEPTPQHAIASIDGNICRCTGYKSIEKAAGKVAQLLEERKTGDPLLYATIKKILPPYFNEIKARLEKLRATNTAKKLTDASTKLVGGGTDLYVQQHTTMVDSELRFVALAPELRTIQKVGNRCEIGGAATVSDLIDSNFFHDHFPEIMRFTKLVSSTPIRNMATIAGNIVNASPIGDLTIFFMALNATLHLSSGKRKREVQLNAFYKGYKKLDKHEEEFIEKISFELPQPGDLFNFEKVSKRTHLDIASVNSALLLKMNGNIIENAVLSAGGVGPTPMYLPKTSAFLQHKEVSVEMVYEAIDIAATEVQPISDARGTAGYKKLLLAQLIKAHFITLFKTLPAYKLLRLAHEEY